jgi:hypothetical protein
MVKLAISNYRLELKSVNSANTIIDKVVERLEIMPQHLQYEVLDFVRALGNQQGISGKDLLKFAGSIPGDELQLIKAAIEQDCEQIDLNKW